MFPEGIQILASIVEDSKRTKYLFSEPYISEIGNQLWIINSDCNCKRLTKCTK